MKVPIMSSCPLADKQTRFSQTGCLTVYNHTVSIMSQCLLTNKQTRYFRVCRNKTKKCLTVYKMKVFIMSQEKDNFSIILCIFVLAVDKYSLHLSSAVPKRGNYINAITVPVKHV